MILETGNKGDDMKARKYNLLISFMAFAFVLTSYTTILAEGGYDFTTKWGFLGSGNDALNQPHGIVTTPSGNVYVADYYNNRVHVFSSAGSYVTKWGTFGTGNGNFKYPDNVAVDSSGNIYVSDENNHRIQKFSSAGVFDRTWGSQGAGDGQFNYPQAIAIDSSDKVYVVDSYNNRIQVFSSTGVFVTKWGSQGAGNGQLYSPRGIAVDTSGNVYVADSGNNRIQMYSTVGAFAGSWGTFGIGDGQFNFPRNVAVDSTGNIYVTDELNARIQKFARGGAFITKWGSYGSADGQFDKPYGITVDTLGNVYVTDYNLHRIQKFTPTTCTYTISPTGSVFSASSNTGTIGVTSLFNFCSWTATTSSSWITITAGASGTSNGTVIYSVTENSGSARTSTITIGGQTFTITQAAWTYSNSIGSRNSIKITDMSGTLSSAGATITVKAWDANGNSLADSGSAALLKVYNNATTTIAGANLASRFSHGTPILYAFTVDSSKVVVTNVNSSSDGTLNIPSGYTSGSTNFMTNSVGSRNSIKITDMSGSLSSSGAAVIVTAWDVNGNSIPESGSAVPLKVYNNATTIISGTDLAARFPSGTPMSYEFSVASTKVVITNVKSSSDGSINIPYVYTNGTTLYLYASNYVSSYNTIKITDLSGILPDEGGLITVNAWDANGNSIPASGSATVLLLFSYGTTTISGSELAARFPTGTPITYEFSLRSPKYIITNLTGNTSGTINVPTIYTDGVAGGI